MSITEIAVAAEQLTLEQRQRLLAHLTFELTIAARATYVPGSEAIAEPRQLRTFNEIQHRVTTCLLDMIESRNDEIWIWPVVAEIANAAGCAREATDACSRAFAGVIASRP